MDAVAIGEGADTLLAHPDVWTMPSSLRAWCCHVTSSQPNSTLIQQLVYDTPIGERGTFKKNLPQPQDPSW